MDFSTLLLGTAMTLLPLIGAGLLAAMVMLERNGTRLSPAAGTAEAQPSGRARTRRQRAGRRRKA